MASITDCVTEGLKYPFGDIKKLLSFGVLFAAVSALSTFIGLKSFEIFRLTVHIVEANNITASSISFSQLPAGDIYLVAGLIVISFIISLIIMGYQYNVVKFSIDRKEDLPGLGNILEIFVIGIKYFIVTLAYNIIPVIILIGGITLVGDSSLLLVIVLISAILFIIAYFLLIMALNNMIAYDDIRKAFDIHEITGNISSLGIGKYIGIILFTLLVMMIISVAVSFILTFLTVGFAAVISNQAVVISYVIAVIEGLFVDSYMSVFFSRVCGSIYRESVK